MKLAFLGLVASSLVFQSIALADAFPLLCRGPLSYRFSRMGITIEFKQNQGGAGEAGNKLVPGACAWVDRAVDPSTEGSTVYVFGAPYVSSSDVQGVLIIEEADNLRLLGALTPALTSPFHVLRIPKVENSGHSLKNIAVDAKPHDPNDYSFSVRVWSKN